jgi:ABC-2 type transport system permease protein
MNRRQRFPALTIARKTLIEYLREPLLIGILFAFPVMIVFFYYVAFGETDQGMAKYLKILVKNQDQGGIWDGETWQAGEDLIETIRQAKFEGSPIFDVTNVTDVEVAEIALRENKASLMLVIPPDFTQALMAGINRETGPSPTTLTLIGHLDTDNFVFARSMLESLLREYSKTLLGWNGDELNLTYEFIPGTGTMSDFEFGIPGVIVFGVAFVAISTAMTMVRENVNGTLRRIQLTPITARDLLLGVTLAQMALALILVPLTLVSAILLGFHSKGSLLLAIGIGLLFSFSQIGLGLLTACFARNDGEAANLSAILAIMTVIISGAIYPMPEAPLFSIGTRTIQIYDLMPPSHAARALMRVLLFGDSLGGIGFELIAIALLSVLLMALGVALYQRLKM